MFFEQEIKKITARPSLLGPLGLILIAGGVIGFYLIWGPYRAYPDRPQEASVAQAVEMAAKHPDGEVWVALSELEFNHVRRIYHGPHAIFAFPSPEGTVFVAFHEHGMTKEEIPRVPIEGVFEPLSGMSAFGEQLRGATREVAPDLVPKGGPAYYHSTVSGPGNLRLGLYLMVAVIGIGAFFIWSARRLRRDALAYLSGGKKREPIKRWQIRLAGAIYGSCSLLLFVFFDGLDATLVGGLGMVLGSLCLFAPSLAEGRFQQFEAEQLETAMKDVAKRDPPD